ncbi:hypothetical protein EYF80_014746 [Liparis tanakae]|uniref:Uncharacterized protein n=1 Tax=Liparis tanakae TaxID=230148 RepID=A0A4Z2IAU5_9TELE|nr:hypothetical protein EYF80_014746 [Liparis tanakae]
MLGEGWWAAALKGEKGRVGGGTKGEGVGSREREIEARNGEEVLKKKMRPNKKEVERQQSSADDRDESRAGQHSHTGQGHQMDGGLRYAGGRWSQARSAHVVVHTHAPFLQSFSASHVQRFIKVNKPSAVGHSAGVCGRFLS